jgi:hypothetical protein
MYSGISVMHCDNNLVSALTPATWLRAACRKQKAYLACKSATGTPTGVDDLHTAATSPRLRALRVASGFIVFVGLAWRTALTSRLLLDQTSRNR